MLPMDYIEELVSYDIAKGLKEIGYSDPCDYFYDAHFNQNRYSDKDKIDRNTNNHHTPSVSAPSLYAAQAYLRDTFNIDIMIDPNWSLNSGYHYVIIINSNFDNPHQQISYPDTTYKESLLNAMQFSISYILENRNNG